MCPRAAASSSAGQSTTAARETSTTTEPGAIASKHAAPIEPTFSVVTGERMKTTLLRAKSSRRATGSTPSCRQSVVGEPGIVREQLAAERPQQRQQRAGEVAAADDADRLAGEQERAAVDAVVEHRLGARANLGIATGNVAGGGERHPERELRDRLAEHRADPEHLDPAGEAGGVVDVREEVALDVEHRVELGCAREALGRERGLADDRHQLGQERLDELRAGGRAVVPGDRAERLEPRTCLGEKIWSSVRGYGSTRNTRRA